MPLASRHFKEACVARHSDEPESNLPSTPIKSDASTTSIPLLARLSHQIPKPKDWQAFQRGCALLFREELKDPNAQEYGRGGQNQGGIDVLGRRNAHPDHYVGIQCRLIEKPLKEEKILSDCRAALKIRAGLKEVIFATSAPDDTAATNAAIAVEHALQNEGYDITVVVYGWVTLQTLIARHEVAYNAFFPAAVATIAPQPEIVFSPAQIDDLAAQIASRVQQQIRQPELTSLPRDVGGAELAQEDPALHARIDTFRDLSREQMQPIPAERGLLALLQRESLDEKPWARFRIESNLAAIALDLGRLEECAKRLEAAYNLRPSDPVAIANLAVARTIQGRFAEAMELAQNALTARPRPDYAIGVLLQAAGRSSWQGDPESLIPHDLVGTPQADLGLAEFIRRREAPHWENRSVELARRHPDMPELKRIKALAVLSLAIASETSEPGGPGSISEEDIGQAADDMKAAAEHFINIGYAHQHDLVSYLSNAGVLLRLVGRQAECEALMRVGLMKVPDNAVLLRLLALAQAAQGHPQEALATLADETDPENRLLAAEIMALQSPAAALDEVMSLNPLGFDQRLAQLRLGLAGELALRVGNEDRLNEALAGLRALDPHDYTVAFIQARWDRKLGVDDAVIRERLLSMKAALPADTNILRRYLFALQLRDFGLPEEAASLLEGRVDLRRATPGATLYLECLAAARRDDVFRRQIASAGVALRNDPDILWTTAAHAWNIGDLVGAQATIDQLLSKEPDNALARLLRIEILVRENRSTELLAELDKPVERLAFDRLRDRFRVASLLGKFGYGERASRLAYRLFLENQVKAQAWMTLSTLILEEGWRGGDRVKLWDTPIIRPDVAVDLRFDDGEELFVVIEPDEGLCSLDKESWEPTHPLVRTLIGKRAGDQFTDPTGRHGTVAKLRHKYVARLHFVLQNYQTRFPEVMGFRRIAIDAEQTGGLNALISELKERNDWLEGEYESYSNGPWFLGVLAHRIGLDTIDAAAGLASQKRPLKVAIGNVPEREAATAAVRANGGKGCVLDLLTFWTAWRLNALSTVAATCGPISLTRSVVDRLHARREEIAFAMATGSRSANYENGRLTVTETAPELLQASLEDIDRAISWVEANARVCPLVVGEGLPPELREHLREGSSDIFDSLVRAVHEQLLLITDDQPTREFGRMFGFTLSAWLHHIIVVSLNSKMIVLDGYIRWTAALIDIGHNYIGVSADALARSASLDFEAGASPGPIFAALSKVIGGKTAEPQSHIMAVTGCLIKIWSDPATLSFRQPITGLLLRQLVRERYDDYAVILRVLLIRLRYWPKIVSYIHDWARGHFLPSGTLS